MTGNNIFDVMEKKSKYYYSFLVGKKAQPPNIVLKLQRNFNFSTDQLKHFFILPHRVALESYVKAFQYKVLTSILYTNTKLHKIGFKLMICVVSARLNQKLFTSVHISGSSGLILNLTGIFYQINGYTFRWKMFYME